MEKKICGSSLNNQQTNLGFRSTSLHYTFLDQCVVNTYSHHSAFDWFIIKPSVLFLEFSLFSINCSDHVCNCLFDSPKQQSQLIKSWFYHSSNPSLCHTYSQGVLSYHWSLSVYLIVRCVTIDNRMELNCIICFVQSIGMTFTTSLSSVHLITNKLICVLEAPLHIIHSLLNAWWILTTFAVICSYILTPYVVNNHPRSCAFAHLHPST